MLTPSENPRRCLLFVPGARPERFEKALAADADQVCIDLEDAVPLAEKAAARRDALQFVAQTKSSRCELGVRINAVNSAEGRADMQAIASMNVKPAFVMLPKVESVADIQHAVNAMPEVPLIALLESPGAVFEARAIAKASPRVRGLMFGGYDYAVAARVTPRSLGWLVPRSMIAMAAAEAGIAAIDVPSLETQNMNVVEQETAEVIALGFSCRAAIHPAQVSVIQRAFLPNESEAAHAKRVVDASTLANGAAIAVDGKLVDLPIELAARRVLSLAQFGLRV
jgi:citrate lyase beta subunit